MQRPRSHSAIEAWLCALCDPAGPRDDGPTQRLSPADLRPLRLLADRHNVLPAVAANLRKLLAAGRADGLIAMDNGTPASAAIGSFLADAAPRLAQHAAVAMYLRRQASLLLQAMRERGVPATILRGVNFADRLYPQPTLRPFVDIDLLVEPQRWQDAVDVMTDQGYQPHDPPMKYPDGYGEQAWRRSDDVGCVVELHSNVVNSPTIRRALSLSLSDLRFEGEALTPASMLLAATVHAAASHVFEKLQHLCDIAQLARGVAGPIDVDWLVPAARKAGATLSLAMGLDLAARTLGCAEAEALLERLGLRWPRRTCRCLITPRIVVRSQTHGRYFRAWRHKIIRQMLKSGS